MSVSSALRKWPIPIAAAVVWGSLLLRQAPMQVWWLPIAVYVFLLLFQRAGNSLQRLSLSTVVGLAAVHAAVSPRAAALAGGFASSGGSWLGSLGQGARQAIAQAARGVSSQASALTLGITDGDVSKVSPETASLFKSLSLTHLTAVSGANCAILIGVLVALLAQLGLGRAARTAWSLVALAAYLCLVGDQPSVLRAAAMAAVTLLAGSRGLGGKTVHLLGLAVLALLLVVPDYSTNLGFALSVFATAGVVLLAPRVAILFKRFMPVWLATSLAVALAAQLCCLPLLIGIQSNPSSAAVLANLLAEPAVAPVTILGLLASVLALLPGAIGLGVSGVVFWVASLPAAYILGMAEWLATVFPSQPMPSGAFGLTFSLFLLLGVWLLTSVARRSIRIGSLALLLAACLFIFGSGSHLPTGNFPGPRWIMVACDVGQGDGTVLRAGLEIAVVDVGKDPRDIDACLTRLRVTRIALLVLTHFDLDHVGGLAGALRNRRVDQALITQFVDARPGAAAVSHELAGNHIPTTAVAQGFEGVLGAQGTANCLHWLVLSPHPGGADAASSNEGSISMFWTGQGLNIFTMADLPAVGQKRLMDERSIWWQAGYFTQPTILKLSHHGSADQDPDFLKWVHPVITTISVGRGNPYGHPTQRALSWLQTASRTTLRTDQLGSIAITRTASGLSWSASGAR